MPAAADEQQSLAAARLLLGFPSLVALTSAPLLFQTRVGDIWDISVYLPSHALFLDTKSKVHVFATSCKTCEEKEAAVELVDLHITLNERISHCVAPHCTSSAAPRVTQQVAMTCAMSNGNQSSSQSRVLRHQQFDPQTIHALGDSFAELLPPAGTLHFTVPRTLTGKGQEGAQPSSSSKLFSVAHELRISAVVRILSEGEKKHRLSFSAPVLVLPDTLANSHGILSPLPCYTSISNDVVLAAAIASSHHHPPEYDTLYI
ncbi:hypothetical protein GGI21_006473 [Coemansia aciculifera]|nr:hypothetical protein GGI21_006473 [Coemansia aciculifera]